MAVLFVNTAPSFQANGLPLDSASDEVDIGTVAVTTEVAPVVHQAAHAGGSNPSTSLVPTTTPSAVNTGDIEMVPITPGPKATTDAAAFEATDLEANQVAEAKKTRWQMVKIFLKEYGWPFVKKLAKWLAGIVAAFFCKEELEDVFGGI